MKIIYSCLILLFLAFGTSYQLVASGYGNVPEFTFILGQWLRIDLNNLFEIDHREVRIYHAEDYFDFTILAEASAYWLCNLGIEDSGIVIIEKLKENGDIIDTYVFRLVVVDALNSTEINQNQTLNLLSYEE